MCALICKREGDVAYIHTYAAKTITFLINLIFKRCDHLIKYSLFLGKTLDEAGYSKFSLGEPNNSKPEERCGSIYRSGLLNDLWCDRPAPFICEKSPDHPPVCRALKN